MTRGPESLAPHGTLAAARRHYRRHEPLCPDCRRADRQNSTDRSRVRRGSTPLRDMTPAGYFLNGMPEFRPYRYHGDPAWTPDDALRRAFADEVAS